MSRSSESASTRWRKDNGLQREPPVKERLRVAEELLASADAEGYEDESDAPIHTAWAERLERRSDELRDGSVRGLSVEEAHRIVASGDSDKDR